MLGFNSSFLLVLFTFKPSFLNLKLLDEHKLQLLVLMLVTSLSWASS